MACEFSMAKKNTHANEKKRRIVMGIEYSVLRGNFKKNEKKKLKILKNIKGNRKTKYLQWKHSSNSNSLSVLTLVDGLQVFFSVSTITILSSIASEFLHPYATVHLHGLTVLGLQRP